ncbi:MAG: cytochrome c3 family protein [Gemmatimonadales bacterium]|nr:cytochrome c3 family protein [Gemmatimonadales bacterium]
MKLSHATSMIVAVALFGACTDERIVYRDIRFNPPLDSVNGFLGYFDASTKQTTCGNCHVGVQGEWKDTKHADAWADLQASGQASAGCNDCHTVSQLGNFVGTPAGYAVVPDSAYHDVQCESCHGPGLAHVENPDIDASHPLASIQVDTGVVTSCSGCHTGVHTPFVEQWKQSAHGSGPGFAGATYAACLPCHEGRAAIALMFGDNSNYIEKGGATPQRIGCVACHNPHGSPYEHQLRAPLDEPSRQQLCVKCHSRIGTPPWSVASSGTATSRGAHGAQGLLVIGENVGWIPPGFAYDTTQMASSHGTSANTKLCATCHVVRTTITDELTGAFTFQSVGHTFEAIPCPDANGLPVPCKDAVPPDTVHDFTACSTGNCHIGGPQVARLAYQTLKGELNNFLDQIWIDGNANGIIDSAGTGLDAGLIPELMARALRPGATAADSAELSFRNNVTSAAKGTLWNAALAATEDRSHFLSGRSFGNTFSTHMASGNGVHNPFLLKALLTSSIAALQTTYGLSAPQQPSLEVTGPLPPGVRRVRSDR